MQTETVKGYVVQHRLHGFIADHNVLVPSADRAKVFDKPLTAVSAALEFWGEEVLVQDIYIRAIGWPQ